MRMRGILLTLAAVACAFLHAACGGDGQQSQRTTATDNAATANKAPDPAIPAALPNNGFKVLLTVPDAPAKLRAGEKTTVQVKVKNVSDVMWYARGAEVNNNPGNQFYLAAANRWLKAADQTLVTDMDGRYGLNRDLKPGEETEVPLLITAPKEAGAYILDVDLVQEQVTWFHDKGSPTAQVKVTVVK